MPINIYIYIITAIKKKKMFIGNIVYIFIYVNDLCQYCSAKKKKGFLRFVKYCTHVSYGYL